MSERDVKRFWASWRIYGAATVVLLVAGCVVAARIDASRAARELPGQMKALEQACATFPLVDAKDAKAVQVLKQSIEDGETKPSRDLRFMSGRFNEGVFVPFPGPRVSQGLQLQLVDVVKDGSRLFTVRLPTLVLRNHGIGLNEPKFRTMGCPQLNEVEFLDFILA